MGQIKNPHKSMILTSFTADALSLGVHWIYNIEKIKGIYGRVEGYIKPPKGSYHEGKEAGDFTHYGDQTLVLFESLAECSGFDVDDFSSRWKKLFENYRGYVDSATRETLENLARGHEPLESGSLSNDLAGASRIAPVVFAYRDKEDELVYAARTQTKMTHNHPQVINAAEFFARVSFKVLRGTSPIQAVQEVQQKRWKNTPIGEWVEKGLATLDMVSEKAIRQFGQSCHIPQAFPSVIHLIGKYERSVKDALIENVMAGGDSAARGMIVGMILGAYPAASNLPEQWVEGLRKKQEILKNLEMMHS